MSDIATQLAEDKALRDAALQLFRSDIAMIRSDLDERGVGVRATDRLSEAALGMIDDAITHAEDRKGWVAAGAAVLVLWFAREPLLRWAAALLEGEEPG